MKTVDNSVSEANEATLTHKNSGIDPATCQFLSFLAIDVQQHPDRLLPITNAIRDCITVLVGDVNGDLNNPLSEEDE